MEGTYTLHESITRFVVNYNQHHDKQNGKPPKRPSPSGKFSYEVRDTYQL